MPRAALRPALPLDPADGRSRSDIDDPVVGGQVGHPVGQPRIDECHGVCMWTVDGLDQGGLPSPRQFVPDGLSDESAPVALEPNEVVDEVGGERHGHACGSGHE